MDQHDRKEIRQIVKKYTRPQDRAVVNHILDTGRLNKSELVRKGVTRKQIGSMLRRLRDKLKDYHDGEIE